MTLFLTLILQHPVGDYLYIKLVISLKRFFFCSTSKVIKTYNVFELVLMGVLQTCYFGDT